MPRNIEARKVLVSHSGPRGMTAVGGEVAWGDVDGDVDTGLGRGCGGVDRMWPSGPRADSFPFIPMWQRAHPALRGTADPWVQEHSEPRRANVRRRVHGWVGPLTTRQPRCYSRTLGQPKSCGSHYPSSRVRCISPLVRLLPLDGISASWSSASLFGNAAQSSEPPAQIVWRCGSHAVRDSTP